MRPSDDDLMYLWDMLDAAKRVSRYVDGKTFEQYEADEVLRDAVERRIEVLGEAAKHVSAEFQDWCASIPWKAIKGQRDYLAHGYQTVRNDILWDVATVHIPALIAQIDPICASTGGPRQSESEESKP